MQSYEICIVRLGHKPVHIFSSYLDDSHAVRTAERFAQSGDQVEVWRDLDRISFFKAAPTVVENLIHLGVPPSHPTQPLSGIAAVLPNDLKPAQKNARATSRPG